MENPVAPGAPPQLPPLCFRPRSVLLGSDLLVRVPTVGPLRPFRFLHTQAPTPGPRVQQRLGTVASGGGSAPLDPSAGLGLRLERRGTWTAAQQHAQGLLATLLAFLPYVRIISLQFLLESRLSALQLVTSCFPASRY